MQKINKKVNLLPKINKKTRKIIQRHNESKKINQNNYLLIQELKLKDHFLNEKLNNLNFKMNLLVVWEEFINRLKEKDVDLIQ